MPRKKKVPSGTRNEVGYGCPPTHTRFSPGQTGNPKGRPRRETSLVAILERSLHKQVTVRSGGRQKRVSLAEALIQQILADATRGDRYARSLVLKLGDPRTVLAAKAAHQANDREDANILVASDQAIVDRYKRELRQEVLQDAGGENAVGPPPPTATEATPSPARVRSRPRPETKS